MFDFFFKRARTGSVNKTGVSAAAAEARPAAKGTTQAEPASAVTSAENLSRRRQQALDEAAALGGDEAAALAFVLRCGVPEARLLAAQQLRSRPLMEQAQKAMREIDRRVAKLMQQRLSALSQQEVAQKRLQAAVARARTLLAEAVVLPNQVVQLDRSWADAALDSGDSAIEFSALRAELGQRLQSQAALQRRTMDLSARLQATSAAEGLTVVELDTTLSAADAAIREIEQDRALSSLPKQLMPELRAARARLQDLQSKLSAGAAAVMAREQALGAWERAFAEQRQPELQSQPQTEPQPETEAAPALQAEPQVQPPAHDLPTPATLRQKWRALPLVQDPEADAALQARFDTLIAQVAPPPAQKKPPRPQPATAPDSTATPGMVGSTAEADAAQSRAAHAAALDELRAALDEGALQRAVEQDRLLRSLDASGLALTSSQQTALSAARAELTRLQGWAKWGGTVSREELVVAVEGLPQQGLGVLELGKKVGSMRERWRALDASAGPAPRPLWLRFDAACGLANAPVAAHFADLARQRAARAEQARAILNDIAAFVAGGELGGEARTDSAAGPDWRAIAGFCQRVEQAWQRLGPLERKQQKQLNAAFEAALQPLRQPLQAQQEQSIALREQLIRDVQELAPQGRETLDRLQSLQAQWQQDAKIPMLARAQEQQLWQRFRSACDAVFAQRKQAAAGADAERAANLARKTELCVALEARVAETSAAEASEAADAASAALQREQKLAWNAIGPVPRAAQVAVQARFDQALAALQGQRDAYRRRAIESQAVVFEQALARCLACERLLMPSPPDGAGPDDQPAWTAPANLPPPLERALRARFDAARAALAAADTAYGQRMHDNRPALDTALLQLEVRLGLESPPGFTRERLQLQVAGLQSSFKNGTTAASAATPLLQLADVCAQPAMIDAVARDRILTIAKAVLKAN